MEILNYIDGNLVKSVTGRTLENIEPATGKAYGTLPDSDGHDVELAYQAANKAFEKWSQTPYQERAKFLQRISAGIRNRLDEFALAESKDNGKPLKLAKSVDIPRAVDNFHFFASAIEQFASESHFMEQSGINYTLRRPIGVVACISPWNLPLYLFSWKIAPALAAGNCVVAKPSEITPATAFLLSKICIEAGLPSGVLNIIHGSGQLCGQAMIEHPGIKAVSFTGGTHTGKKIAGIAAPMFKKLSLELGGKNPTIIFNDADIDQTLKTIQHSAFANQGQICLCGSRILIQNGIYEEFKNKFVEKTKQMRIGDPLDEVQLGAVVSEQHMQKILTYIEIAKEEGGTILCGGERYFPESERIQNGYYLTPTIIEGLSQQCRTNQEEIFGPVVTLDSFETEEEAIQKANASEYGLASSVWTQNLNTALRVSEKLNTGIVWVNCWLLRDLRTPFGGMKNSGVGREGGWEALRFFTEPKNVCIKYH